MANIMTLSLTDFSTSSSNDSPHQLNRFIGGHTRKNHPFISGYWYLILVPPTKIFNESTGLFTDWFHSTAEGFTPPNRSITKVDVPGMGGMGSSFIAGQEITREFSATFREYQNLPIIQALRTWGSVIDPHLGRSGLTDTYLPSDYKGQCFAILSKPILSGDNKDIKSTDIDQVYYMEGVFPTTVPDDAFSQDIATNDVVQLSVTFSFDGGFFTKEVPEVVNAAVQRLNELNGIKNSFDKSISSINAS